MPDATPSKLRGELGGVWHRLVLSLFGISIVEATWWFAIKYLYTLPTAAIAGFVSLTTNAFYVQGAIVIFMVTGVLIYNWSNRTDQVTQVTSEAMNEVQDIKEAVTGNRSPKDFLDDGEADH
jgi:hypothetical protein